MAFSHSTEQGKLDFYCYILKGWLSVTYRRFNVGDLYNEVDACSRLRDGLPACRDAPTDPVMVPLAVLQLFFLEEI